MAEKKYDMYVVSDEKNMSLAKDSFFNPIPIDIGIYL